MLIRMKCLFKTSKFADVRTESYGINFQPLEVVGLGIQTQLQVGGNLHYIKPALC